MYESIKTFLSENIGSPYSATIVTAIILCGIALASFLAYKLARYILREVQHHVEKTDTEWDNDLLNNRMLSAIAQLIPALVVNWLLPGFFGEAFHWLRVLTGIYILCTYIYMVLIFSDNLYEALLKRPAYRSWTVKGLFQTIKGIAIAIGVLVCASILFGRSVLGIVTALGATAGITMLVFKDTILGFVASVQLTANKMLQKDDWIIADRHGANGKVQEITLTSVKVKNWDNSITTIPPYSLISDSFRNYQNMFAEGSRCVERAIYIDINTVRFCTPAETEALKQRGLLADGNANQINIKLLREYLERYLHEQPDINLTSDNSRYTMVRQLAPTQSGLPLQLRFYLTTTDWRDFEHRQSDIFDHVYAVIREFGLRMFQTPAGSDIHKL